MDQHQPELVSVVIPTFNRAYCIERAIDSVLSQTHPSIEIVVVDDGSTDNTSEVLAGRYASDARVRCIRQANSGVSAARNTGLRAARGDFIAVLESDETWKPWKAELQVRCLRRLPGAGMIWTDMEAVNPEGEQVFPTYLRRMYGAYRRYPSPEALFGNPVPVADVCPAMDAVAGAKLYHGDIFSPMITGSLVHTSTVMLRRSRLEQVVGFNEELKYSGEDYDFHLRTCLAGEVAFVDVSSIRYRIDGTDQLTQPAYAVHMARNKLRTITPLIASERARIRLPEAVLADIQARAHAWVGREALMSGDSREARTHLVASLRFRLFQPETLGYLALASLPRPAFRIARLSRHYAKHLLSALGIGP